MRPHHSIGDVLNELRDEFPDITISKIRFLESQGLIAPERTPSGYRKFYAADVARLRWILRQQKDHFLPLKVIKDRLDTLDPTELDGADHTDGDGTSRAPRPLRPSREEAVDALFEAARREAAAQEADRVAAAVAHAADGGAGDDDLTGAASSVSLTRDELAAAAGLDDAQLAELESFGLVQPLRASADRALFGEESLAIARVAASFMRFGIEPRHLRMYRAFVDREVTLFDQVLLPYRRQRNPEAQAKADELHRELAGLGRRLRAALLQQVLRQHTR
jgi:DNA-binding transcriptional MerR regulator